ncbi:hypothetical protein ISCGN_019087 [Ixodes scapularis]
MASAVPEWTTDITRLKFVDGSYVNRFYSSRTSSDRQSRRSYKFVTESYVYLPDLRTMPVFTSAGETHHLVTGTCYKSQKKTQPPYKVKMMSPDEVLHTSCNCPAGAAGYYNHTMAILRMLALLAEHGYSNPPTELSPTELPQQWSRPRHRMAAESVLEVNWRRVEVNGLSDALPCKLFDVRKRKRSVNEQEEAVLNLAQDLLSLNPEGFGAVLLEAESAVFVPKKFGAAPVGSAMAVQLPEQQLRYEFKTVFTELSDEVRSMRSTDAAVLCLFEESEVWLPSERGLTPMILKDIVLTADTARELEFNTRLQSRCNLWKECRRFRITASVFQRVCDRKQPWSDVSLNNLLRPKDIGHAAPVKYGILNEPRAVERHEEVMDLLGYQPHTHASGLLVPPQSPWIGATPDRFVYCAHEDTAFGVLELKCPWTKRSSTVSSALADPCFYIEMVNGKPYSKKSTSAYYQVMGQMYCAGLSWAHFVVFSSSWLIITKVKFDQAFWDATKLKLDRFYFDVALPFFLV